ncbi:SMC family ATPase [Stomatohabitans albus]|uniref:SMC family ATPase n=1 Tax=Stomatohabitans albus TaxID=3110766 RepID=UPI00300C5005
MKPEQLTIRGLATFTEETVISFSDLGLFAVVGPTGSGKSSIIDAICFVLYGRVARLGGRTIEPLISVGAKEMAVALTFSIRATTYRAIRRVKRTKQGASTDEAALERLSPNPQVLAATADELTEAVTGLLGLTFDEFTKAVVLPQGAFASLLTATPKDRQNLLSSLLGTGLYEQIRQQASTESKVAEAMASQLRVQVHQVGDVQEADLAQAMGRVEDLQRITDAVDQAFARLEAGRAAYAQANEEVKRQKGLLDALDAIGPAPKDLVAHGERVATLATQVQTSESAYRTLLTQRDALGEAPDTAAAHAAIRAHGQTKDLIQAHLQATKQAEAWAPMITEKEQELAPAQEALHRARIHRDQIARDNAAAEAAKDLHEGDTCPVCANTVTAQAPALGMQADQAAIYQAQQRYDHAIRTLEGVKVAINNATAQAKQDEERARSAKAALEAHEREIAALMTMAQAQSILDQETTFKQRWRELSTAVSQAATTLERDQRTLASEQQASEHFIQVLDQYRLNVASLQPPAIDTGDVVGSWERLVTWAHQTRPGVAEAWNEAESVRNRREQEGMALRNDVQMLCQQAGVDMHAGEPPIAVARALTQASVRVEQLQTQLAQVASWKQEIDIQDERSAVYAAVAKHLGARAFPTWLLHETTVMLVAGASKHMQMLSNGQYQLAMDGNDIVVIDRSNANLTRSVRTLSGGETFLASLALALALADYIHRIAASPVAIDSLFIDEGFGSLDSDALDQAAQALEQLGATDRMVGVITHVPELAERLPNRIRVLRQAGSSKIVSE